MHLVVRKFEFIFEILSSYQLVYYHVNYSILIIAVQMKAATTYSVSFSVVLFSHISRYLKFCKNSTLLSFQTIIESLLSADDDFSTLLQRFQEYLEYDDVRYFTMKHALSSIKRHHKQVII